MRSSSKAALGARARAGRAGARGGASALIARHAHRSRAVLTLTHGFTLQSVDNSGAAAAAARGGVAPRVRDRAPRSERQLVLARATACPMLKLLKMLLAKGI
ncbi:hypothetical protein JYU34_009286 [Plutella xylostella]|uniref:Uncharacterized protein n=1 Tax=Plutella xylostella TaxID=51655 RepID=A0ABQ7QJ35_PLUXY|nr:hypothetical protein JYU34_009286 [Plutella xylostella]